MRIKLVFVNLLHIAYVNYSLQQQSTNALYLHYIIIINMYKGTIFTPKGMAGWLEAAVQSMVHSCEKVTSLPTKSGEKNT